MALMDDVQRIMEARLTLNKLEAQLDACGLSSVVEDTVQALKAAIDGRFGQLREGLEEP